jgi:NhaP-type Na+/H+ or K+/H+ antiporter
MIPFWYIVIAVLWTGFFILEGFDFGVGMLHAVVGTDEAGRRAATNTIGPLWDGNEVWLIVAGAGMFAAFPGWYATMFSAYNLALVLLLAALIVRGLAFGPSFEPLVSLSVAVILYDAGLDMDLRKLRGHTRRIVTRLIVVGVPVTWVIAATCAARLVGMSNRAALMTGAILVVSGPTVVGPLLNTIRPAEGLQRVLTWEGSLIDPIGGILGAVVFGAVTTSTRRAPAYQFSQFLLGIGIGIAGGIAGTAILWFLLRTLRLGEVLGTTSQLATLVGVAAACDIVCDDAGLVAAVIMGLAVANIRRFDIPARRPFFAALVQLIIGILVIAISATVTPQSVRHLFLPVVGLVAVLVLVTRPLVAMLATLRTDMPACERRFTGWMAPRGIVAAATAVTL